MHGVASAIQLVASVGTYPRLEMYFFEGLWGIECLYFRILAIHACRAIVETSHVLHSSFPPNGFPATATGMERGKQQKNPVLNPAPSPTHCRKGHQS